MATMNRITKHRQLRGHRPRLQWLPAMIFVIATAQAVEAHDARPLSVLVVERAPHVYHANLSIPPSVDSFNEPSVVWPDGCRSTNQSAASGPEIRRITTVMVCSDAIEGRTIGVRYPLFNPSLSTLVRLTDLDGILRTAVLPPDQHEWQIPARPSRLDVARDYLLLGIEHIWAGIDHLLFVAGLLILARTPRRILLVVTGFTIAHSITLSLSALGLVNLPVAPTEAAIALSILFLAGEIARPGEGRLPSRYPVLVSSSFGLLHGLGFAAALGEIGLPPGEIAISLLFFNLGVEAGQVSFILPILGMAWMSTRLGLDTLHPRIRLAVPVMRSVVVYCIGILASFWFVQRLAAF
jgi:hydrogenase/urease accessory protein HupE